MSIDLPPFPHHPPEKWMSDIPDSIHINKLRIPGTHNSGTGSKPSKKFISKAANFAAYCHTLDIMAQLNSGIRYIDVRLKYEPNGELNVYHKVVRYDITFSDILNIISDFLTANSEECIMIRLHREDGDPGGTYRLNNVSDKMFVDALVANLHEFEEKERAKRIIERDQNNTSNENNENKSNNINNESNNENNNDEYLNAIYNKESDNPLLGEVRRKIILFGVRHVADIELLRDSPFKFREINKQAEFKLKCNDIDVEKKKDTIIDGFRKSTSNEFQNSLFVNEINAIGSLPVLSFIPCPRKMAEIMNNITESILIQLIKNKTENNNNILNESNNENHNAIISNSGQNENNYYENDFQGVLMFDFQEISKGGNLIELVYCQNFI